VPPARSASAAGSPETEPRAAAHREDPWVAGATGRRRSPAALVARAAGASAVAGLPIAAGASAVAGLPVVATRLAATGALVVRGQQQADWPLLADWPLAPVLPSPADWAARGPERQHPWAGRKADPMLRQCCPPQALSATRPPGRSPDQTGGRHVPRAVASAHLEDPAAPADDTVSLDSESFGAVARIRLGPGLAPNQGGITTGRWSHRAPRRIADGPPRSCHHAKDPGDDLFSRGATP
jgi:hypothetical protein